MKVLLALLKREVLETSSLWKIPLLMLVIGLLIKISLSVGSLAININVTDVLGFDDSANDVVDSAVGQAVSGSLWFINALVTMVMVLVAIVYTLSCLYTERQDQSVLFWRSLPTSDALTVASKLLIALVLIPLLIIFCHLALAALLLSGHNIEYLPRVMQASVIYIFQMSIWIMLPLISWCLLCSSTAKKNPFLLAFIIPLILLSIDYLFLSSTLNKLFLNVLYFKSYGVLVSFIVTFCFSSVCVFLATIKRSQRI